MPKKKVNIKTFIDSDNDELDDTEVNDSELVDSESESINADQEDKESISEEINYKKRGPKKKFIKINPNINFKLDEADVNILSNDNPNMTDMNLPIYSKQLDKHNRNTFNKPWVEKYRPSNVHELVLNDGTLNKIKKIIEEKSMPNIIITGPPGVGKTTSILCIAKNLLGKYFKEGVLELNASDERGVKTVHESMEYFCKKKLDIDEKYAQHKIVLLDEADNMTLKAQQSIKNLIKEYNNTTRFAFTCNNSSDIIESIQSRCIIFRYIRLTNIQLLQRLKKICELEKIDYTEDGLQAIIVIARGDLRQAINSLQLTYNGYIKVIPENVYKLCDKPHPLVIENIFQACYQKNIVVALKYLSELRDKGYSSSDISISMINTLKTLNKDIFDEKTKIRYMEEITRTCLVISKGLNSELQLDGAIAFLCKQ